MRRVLAVCVFAVVHFFASGPARSQEVDPAIIGAWNRDQRDAAGMVKRTVLEFRLDGRATRHESADFFSITPRGEVDRDTEPSIAQRDRILGSGSVARNRGQVIARS
jgi:hypothetical protein